VLLITEALARENLDAFDFKVVAFIKHRKCSPWASIKFR